MERYHDAYVADQQWSSKMLEQGGEQIAIPYIGITWRSTPLDRLWDDQVSKQPSRLTNLINCGVEKSQLALNSASGGFAFAWEPDGDFLKELRDLICEIPSIPSPTPTNSKSQQISTHLATMYKYWTMVQATTHGTLASASAMQEIKSDALSNIVPVGNTSTLAVFVSKDITEEACKGGFGYSSPAAGPGPALEHRIRNLFGKNIHMPRTDLWPCMPGCPDAPAAVTFLSEYLMIVKPVLIVSHSAVVARALREDKLSNIWQSEQKCNTFLALSASSAFTPSSPPPELTKHINTDDDYTLKPWPEFTDIVGSIAVIRFGPHLRDVALHIPERHTGSAKYNPRTQNAMCELHIVCKAVFVVAAYRIYQSHKYLEQATDEEYLPRLNTIRKAIENDLKEKGIEALLKKKRDTARKQESELMCIRMKSFHERNPSAREHSRGNHLQHAVQAAGRPLNEEELKALPDDVFAETLDMSVIRTQQWMTLMKPLQDAVDRGIQPLSALCPAIFEFLSIAHRNWFLSLPQDTFVKQSAIIRGKKLRTKWDPAQWDIYHKQRDIVGERNRTPFNFMQVMITLARPTSLASNDSYLLLQCQDCGICELKSGQSLHICAADPTGKKKIQNALKNSPFNYRYLYYPHDVYDNLAQEHRSTIQARGVFSEEDAATIIRRSTLPQVIKDQVPDELTLGKVFYLKDSTASSTDHWLNTMAVDRFLQYSNRAQFSAFNQQEGDNNDITDNFYTEYNVQALFDHVERHILDPEPVLTLRCGAIDKTRCDKWTVHFPFLSSTGAQGQFKTRQAQHNCSKTGVKSERGLINGGTVICSLLEFPEPLTRRYWRQARSKEYAGGQVKENVQSKSHMLLTWESNREAALEFSFDRMDEQRRKSKRD
ncbi:hypothetical protein BGZ93_011285 [Podila epicladia]|nr:hypothetical protein BGZ93_011285 [Podila epicladia]